MGPPWDFHFIFESSCDFLWRYSCAFCSLWTGTFDWSNPNMQVLGDHLGCWYLNKKTWQINCHSMENTDVVLSELNKDTVLDVWGQVGISIWHAAERGGFANVRNSSAAESLLSRKIAVEVGTLGRCLGFLSFRFGLFFFKFFENKIKWRALKDEGTVACSKTLWTPNAFCPLMFLLRCSDLSGCKQNWEGNINCRDIFLFLFLNHSAALPQALAQL